MNIEYFIPQTGHGWYIVMYFFLTLIVVLAVSEGASRIFKLSREFSRKFIHISVGILVVIFSFYLKTPQPLVFLCLLFSIANFFVKRYNLVPSMQSKRETYGTIYYPLAILVAIFLFWDSYHFIFINVVLIMALADAFAAIIGQAVKKPVRYKVWDDWKSLQGSAVFFLVTFIIIVLSLEFLKPLPDSNINFSIYVIALLVGLVTTLAESVSAKGSDNFSITLIAGFFLYIFFYAEVFYQQQFIEAIIFACLIAIISVRLNFLKTDGAVSMALMAMFIYGIGGWQWTVPVLTFFITSSLLSKTGRRNKIQLRLLFEKSSKRDARQVFANGGVALIIIHIFFLTQQHLLFYLYLVSLAAANADTWATELGVFNKSKPRLVTSLKKVEKGSSGAISLLGSIAAFIGSLVIILSGIFYTDNITFSTIFLLSLCGFFATYIDSLLGATVQAQYHSNTPSVITEKAYDSDGKANTLFRGYHWLNNDIVNFVSILSSPIFYLLLTFLI